MDNGTFPKGFKISEVIPVYKKDGPYDKHLPTHSILSHLSKIYDRCMHDEIRRSLFSVSSAFEGSITIVPTLLPLFSIAHHLSFILREYVEYYGFYGSLLDILTVWAS